MLTRLRRQPLLVGCAEVPADAVRQPCADAPRVPAPCAGGQARPLTRAAPDDRFQEWADVPEA